MKLTRHDRLGAEEFVTDAVSWTVSIHQTLLFLTAGLLIIWISEESIRTRADWFVTASRALSIATTDDRSSTSVLAFKQTGVTTHTCVSVTTVHIIGAPGLLDTETILASVQRWTLGVVRALGNTTAAITQLVVKTVSRGLARW